MFTSIGLMIALLSAGPSGGQEPTQPARAAAPARPQPTEVARVNGVAITDERLARAVSKLIPFESFHRNVSPEKLVEVQRKALDGVIDEELQYQDAVSRRIPVTAAEVDGRLATIRRQDGSQQKLAQALRESGITTAQFRSEIRRLLTLEKVHARTVTAKCQVGREEASRYFRDHPERFVQPEQLHISAITIGVDPSSPAEKWTEAKAAADDVLARLLQGASFEEMAKTYSTDPSKDSGGDMGLMHRGTLNEDFEKAIRDLPLGRPSAVVRTLYGYHIVRVTEVHPPQAKTFAEVGAGLQKDLTSERCAEAASAWTARLRASATVEITGLPPKADAEGRGQTP